MDIKKTMSLKNVFIRFLGTLILLLAVAVIIPILMLLLGVEVGYLQPANLNEQALQNATNDISSADVFSADFVPDGIEYILLDKSFAVLENNMDERDADNALLFARGQQNNSMTAKRFSLITRDNEYVVVMYSMHSSYSNDVLNRVLPAPEVFCYILMAIGFVIACTIATATFSKTIKKQLLPLHAAAKEIGNHNLDFDVGYSRVREFNDVLSSLNRMKSELQISLEKQWQGEQQQRKQIAALAHDLKTPLTVIYGNADLLYESKLTDEQVKYTKNLLEYAEYMNQSVSSLIELSKSSVVHAINLENVNTYEIVENIKVKLEALVTLKGISVEFCENTLPEYLQCDATLLEQAIMNIISNAVDFTPANGMIRIEAMKENDYFKYTVLDSGNGFSKNDLANAIDYFYMGDPSRSSRNHYGMGLSIVSSVMKQHNGKLLLENGMGDLKGAKVTILVPLVK